MYKDDNKLIQKTVTKLQNNNNNNNQNIVMKIISNTTSLDIPNNNIKYYLKPIIF